MGDGALICIKDCFDLDQRLTCGFVVEQRCYSKSLQDLGHPMVAFFPPVLGDDHDVGARPLVGREIPPSWCHGGA